MKFSHPIYKALSGRILLVFLAILFTICVLPVNAAQEPGTVTIVLPEEPVSVDPNELARNIEGSILNRNVTETLTELNTADGTLKPVLATSWKQIDANTWQFSLRKGIKFHDGEDFNADAVLFSLKRLYDKRIQSGTRDKFFVNKVEGKALNRYTVEFRTEGPEPLMGLLMGLMPIVSPNTIMGKYTRNPIGTGPYKFVKWDAGTQIVLERFDGYWGKLPQVKKAIYIWRTESSVRAAMVAVGEADLSPITARQDADKPGDLDFSYLNTETSYFRIGGPWISPLNDVRVRKALNYAVDREGIKGSILGKDVIPAAQLVVPGIFGFNPDLKPYPYDPEKAKQLLAEARKDGVPVDKEILLVGRIGIYPGSQELVEAMLTMYQAVGFNMKLRVLEQGKWQEYNRKPYPNVPYVMQGMHDNNKGDAVFTIFKDHSKGNQSATNDPTIDDLIERAQRTAPGKGREQLFQAAFKRLQEEVVSNVFMFHMVGYARVSKRINFRPSRKTVIEIPLVEIAFK